jgi:predicted HicB family RNase H-like nuclease
MFVVQMRELQVNKTIRVPISWLERVEIEAKNNGVSLNELIRQAVEYALNDMRSNND